MPRSLLPKPIHHCLLSALLLLAAPSFAQHDHSAAPMPKAARLELGTSAAVDRENAIWVISKQTINSAPTLTLQRSTDLGATWSAAITVPADPFAADGESRPKLAFGPHGELYISYTQPLSKPYTGAIRFIRSLDGGKSFSAPITVHANRDEITHRFESMLVDREGKIFIAWIDKRDAERARANGQTYAGAALYYAVSSDAGKSFDGDFKAAEHSCECCRIALALNPDGDVMALWRHVFEPNARDHALIKLPADGKVGELTRATFDDWRIDACPHHGPALAFDDDGNRHQVWFNLRGDIGGVFYAKTDRAGVLSTPMQLGSAQAEHADLLVDGARIVLVWKQFDGQSTAILARQSNDHGQHWTDSTLLITNGTSDYPHLIQRRGDAVLLWRTQNEGVRLLKIGESK